MSKIKTIGSISISRSSNKLVYIAIEDEHSSDTILEIELTLEDFGALVSGMGGMKGLMSVYTDANIATERLVKKVIAESIPKYQHIKDNVREQVEQHFLTTPFAQDGWEILNDGTRSRQDNKHGYEYSIVKYVPVEDPTKLSRKL